MIKSLQWQSDIRHIDTHTTGGKEGRRGRERWRERERERMIKKKSNR